MSRRFEFIAGLSAKFWEVTVAGADVIIRYGRLGTDGQTLTKSFADAASAQKQAEKLLGEKLKKGYVEVALR
jgi:predicted DNA-binding WGR domain protein